MAFSIHGQQLNKVLCFSKVNLKAFQEQIAVKDDFEGRQSDVAFFYDGGIFVIADHWIEIEEVLIEDVLMLIIVICLESAFE